MTKEAIKSLLEKYRSGQANPEEIAILETWFIKQKSENLPTDEEIVKDLDDIWAKLNEQPQSATRLIIWPRISVAAAASILLFLSIGGYFIFHKPSGKQQIVQKQTPDIAPARNQATLILANGKKIVLTKGLSGLLARQGNTLIKINDGNALSYTSGKSSDSIQYNTLTTNTGEQSPFPLILADGSKIWLNAASSITFPTAFNGKDRVVKITGEAYFEIAHKINQTFKVLVNGQTIEDIGTHFNINAYHDEPNTKTTLLEGSIKISNIDKATVLKPGQQAIVSDNSNNIIVKNIDSQDAIAWKNGLFHFESANVPAVMREFARWYDMDVKYQGAIPAKAINGNVNRSLSASNALQVLSGLDIHYKIEGRKITITP